jgi:hypothetical protein
MRACDLIWIMIMKLLIVHQSTKRQREGEKLFFGSHLRNTDLNRYFGAFI